MGLMSKLFGTHSDHELKRIYPIADKIEALEPQMQALSDEELRAKTAEFKDRYQPARTWTTCCRRPSPPCARPPGACWA